MLKLESLMVARKWIDILSEIKSPVNLEIDQYKHYICHI
jgi:hypothetical protein